MLTSPPGSPQRRLYRRPSVHEVVLDITFSGELTPATLNDVPSYLGDGFGAPQRIEHNTIEVVSGVGFQADVQAKTEFGGWQFESGTAPRWLVRVARDRLTLNMLRSERWPVGDYVGWEQIVAKFESIHAALLAAHGELPTKRLGLRYLNRFAVPAGASLEDWLNTSLRVPAVLQGPRAFRVRHTWRTVRGYDDLSATVNLANVPVSGGATGDIDALGVLFDIDIFNVSPSGAPPYREAMAWFARAHRAENLVFESCITDRLRAIFDEE